MPDARRDRREALSDEPPCRHGGELFHRDPVGTRRAGGKGRVEIEVKPRVLGEGIVRGFVGAIPRTSARLVEGIP